jgi:phage terminase large subunit GpA-like protein
MNHADGYMEVVQAAVAGAKPDPVLHVDVWSEEHMILPKSSASPGNYRIGVTPYARRVLQCLSPGHPCKRVVVRGASQILKTQLAINWLMASIHQAPANMIALEPTDKLAKRLSARISQSIKDIDVVRAVVAAPRSRDTRNTIDAKDFDGGSLYIVTAGAAANLAEIPARYVFMDEIDRLEMSVDGEGDPVELAEARATTFESNCKFYEVSSPTMVGASKIDTLHGMGTQETYHVPCPHCGHLHALVIENFHYQRDPDTGYMDRAWFVCPECGAEIDEHHKSTMLPDEVMGGQARWVAASRGDGETVSFQINAFYAKPGDISWLTLARQLARARDRAERGDNDGLQVFWNTRLALSYENALDGTTAKDLQSRAEPYPSRIVPDAALVLTMAVDTQGNRLEVQIEAWGPGLEHWVIDHIVLYGSPTDAPDVPGSVWARLDEIRRTPIVHASGILIQISAYGIDSGGGNTQDVYNYGASRQRLGCVILKGQSRPNKPIIGSAPSRVDIDWAGQRIAQGAMLWMVGTDVAKDHLYNRFALASGPGAMHFHSQLPAEWFEQLVIERRQLRYRKGRPVIEWIKGNGDRNEALDLAVYNLAIAHHLGLHKWSAQDWARLRAKLIPPQVTPDLFSVAPPPVPQTLPEPQTPTAPVPDGSPSAAPPHPAPAQQPPSPQQQAATSMAAPLTRRRTLSKGLQ